MAFKNAPKKKAEKKPVGHDSPMKKKAVEKPTAAKTAQKAATQTPKPKKAVVKIGFAQEKEGVRWYAAVRGKMIAAGCNYCKDEKAAIRDATKTFIYITTNTAKLFPTE